MWRDGGCGQSLPDLFRWALEKVRQPGTWNGKNHAWISLLGNSVVIAVAPFMAIGSPPCFFLFVTPTGGRPAIVQRWLVDRKFTIAPTLCRRCWSAHSGFLAQVSVTLLPADVRMRRWLLW